MKAIASAVIVALLLCACVSADDDAGYTKVTKKEAIKIAKDKADELGYDTGSMDMEFGLYTTPWKMVVIDENITEYTVPEGVLLVDAEYAANLNEKLRGREYWSVYFAPEQGPETVTLDGDIRIFIDASTGEILHVIRFG